MEVPQDVFINSSGEEEVSQREKYDRLRKRLGEIFGQECVRSPNWMQHGWSTSKFCEIDTQCWCTTPIGKAHDIFRTGKPERAAYIGSVCWSHFKTWNPDLYEHGIHHKKEYRVQLENNKCVHCNELMRNRMSQLKRDGFCSKECEAKHHGRVCTRCSIPILKSGKVQEEGFCTKECKAVHHGHVCTQCSEPLTTKTQQSESFCSDECEEAYERDHSWPCPECGCNRYLPQPVRHTPILELATMGVCMNCRVEAWCQSRGKVFSYIRCKVPGCETRFNPEKSWQTICRECYQSDCAQCGAEACSRAYVCRKGKPDNIGRVFRTCSECKLFTWL
jgi:hypothetical protein